MVVGEKKVSERDATILNFLKQFGRLGLPLLLCVAESERRKVAINLK